MAGEAGDAEGAGLAPDEPVVLAREAFSAAAVFPPFLVAVVAVVAGVILAPPRGDVRAELWQGLGALVTLAAIFALGALTAVWLGRRVVVTDRRVVEFHTGLARLARRWPERFSEREARARRVVDLGDVFEARRDGHEVVLRPRQGSPVRLTFPTAEVAAPVMEAIDRGLRALGRPAARRPIATPSLGVHVAPRAPTPATSAAPRCPYCHDDLAADAAAACPRCGAGHHAECLAIHGRCAVAGCGGVRRRARA